MKANKLFFVLPIVSFIALIGCQSNQNSSINSVDSSSIIEPESSSTIEEERLVSLEIDYRQTETSFMVEDMFKRPFVLAKYSTNRVKNVSKEVDITGLDMNTAGDQILTVTYQDVSTTYVVHVCDNELDYFCGKIAKYQGQIIKSKFTIERTTGYLTTGSGFFNLTLKDVGTTNKYKRGDTYIIDTNGTASYINDDGTTGSNSKYQTQLYDDGEYFYKITYYPKFDWDNTYQKLEFSKDLVEDNYDIGFINEDIRNVKIMKQHLNDVEFSVETNNFECEIVDDILSYSYTYTQYEIDVGGFRVPLNKISYETKAKIEDGYISHLEQKYALREYYGGVEVQNVLATHVADYTYGDYSEFTGKLLGYVEVPVNEK